MGAKKRKGACCSGPRECNGVGVCEGKLSKCHRV